MDHFKRLERMYASARITTFFESELEVSDGSAQITLPVDDRYHHGFDNVHGSVYFKLLDDAAYFAAASQVSDRAIVTVSFSIQMMRAVSGGTLIAEGHVVSNSGRILVAEAQVVDDEENLIAIGHGTFSATGLRLDSVPGYSQG